LIFLSPLLLQAPCLCHENEQLESASEEKDFSPFTISQIQGFLRIMTGPSAITCERFWKNAPNRRSPSMAYPAGAWLLRTTPYKVLASICSSSSRAFRTPSTRTVTSADASVSFESSTPLAIFSFVESQIFCLSINISRLFSAC
jgi:hypothetical protein